MIHGQQNKKNLNQFGNLRYTTHFPTNKFRTTLEAFTALMLRILRRFRKIAKLQKKRLLASSCLSVSVPVHRYVLSVRMEQLGSQLTDFHKILYKSLKKIQVSLQSDKNKRYFI